MIRARSRRGTEETIRAALLSADLRDFTALSEASEPAAMIAALDAWSDRAAGAAGRTRAARYRRTLRRLHPAGCVIGS